MIDDYLPDEIELDVFGEEIFDFFSLGRYRSAEFQSDLGIIAHQDINFTMGWLEYLQRVDTKVGIKATAIIAKQSKTDFSRAHKVKSLVDHLSSDGFLSVAPHLKKIDSGFDVFTRYVMHATAVIDDNTRHPKIRDAIGSLAKLSQGRKRINPSLAIRMALGSSVASQYFKATKSSFSSLPDGIQTFLKTTDTPEKYIAILKQHSSTARLPIHRFSQLDEFNLDYLRICAQAFSGERAEFFLDVKDQVHIGAIGKKTLQDIYKHVPASKRMKEIKAIKSRLFPCQMVQPDWMVKLRKSIREGKTVGQFFKYFDSDEYKTRKIASIKNSYSELAERIGTHPWIAGLEQSFLQALSFQDDAIGAIDKDPEGMLRNHYRLAVVQPVFILGMYQSFTPAEIDAFELTDDQGDVISGVSGRHRGILLWLGRTACKDYEMLETMRMHELVIFNKIANYAKNPKQYWEKLTNVEKEIIEETKNHQMKSVIKLMGNDNGRALIRDQTAGGREGVFFLYGLDERIVNLDSSQFEQLYEVKRFYVGLGILNSFAPILTSYLDGNGIELHVKKAEIYNALDRGDQVNWRDFEKATGVMEQVSTADFKLVSKAYDMAKQHGQGKMLTSNLGTVIENDNVQEWATTIIDGLNSKQNAIGGDTYRGVAV